MAYKEMNSGIAPKDGLDDKNLNPFCIQHVQKFDIGKLSCMANRLIRAK